jgi:zinc-ribbon domain
MSDSPGESGAGAAPGWWLAADGTWRTPSEVPAETGPSMRKSKPPVHTAEEAKTDRCHSCGARMRPGASFCSRCGVSPTETNSGRLVETNGPVIAGGAPFEAPPERSFPNHFVDWLLEFLPVEASVVVCLDLALRRPQRLEVRIIDHVDALTQSDRDRLMDAVDAAVRSEGYVAAEIDSNGTWATMVWHIVDGNAFPLSSRHAEAVMSFHHLVVPSGTGADQAIDAADFVAR